MIEPSQPQQTEKQRRFPKNPYRNILVCSICGAPMRYEQCNLNGANPYVAYVCSTAFKKGPCSPRRTRFTYADSLIRQALQDEIALANSLYARIESGEKPRQSVQAEEQYQQEIQRQLDDIRHTHQEFQNLHMDFLAGMVDEEDYQKQKELLMEQNRIGGRLLVEATEQIQSFRSVFTKDNPWLNLYQGKILPDILPQKQSKAFLERVQLSPEGEISVTFRHQDWKEKLLAIMEE